MSIHIATHSGLGRVGDAESIKPPKATKAHAAVSTWFARCVRTDDLQSMQKSVSRTVAPKMCAATLVLAATALVAQAQAQAATLEEPITLGVVTILSGPSAAPFGVPARNAAELMAEALNAGSVPVPYERPGLGGSPISLKFVDEAGEAARQIDHYRKLVERENVDAVIGYISSTNCMAVAPLADELRRLTVFFDCGTLQVFENSDYKYLFRTGATATMDSTAAALYVAEMKPHLKSVAGINQDYNWGHTSWNTFEAAIRALVPGVRIVSSQMTELMSGSYEAEISVTRHAQILHSSFWGSDAEALVQQGAPRDLFRRSLVVMTAGEPIIERMGTQVPDGTIIGARGPFAMFAPETALNRWFRKAYLDRYSVAPSYPAYKMAQAILGVKSAWEKAQAANGGNRPTQEETVAAFEHLRFEGPGGLVDMSLGKGHQAVQDTAYGTTRHVNGKVILVDVQRYAAVRTTPPDGVKSDEWIRSGIRLPSLVQMK